MSFTLVTLCTYSIFIMTHGNKWKKRIYFYKTSRNRNFGHEPLFLLTCQMAIKSLQLSPYPSSPTVKVTVTMHSLPNGTCTFYKNGWHASFLFHFLIFFFSIYLFHPFSVETALPSSISLGKGENALYKMHFPLVSLAILFLSLQFHSAYRTAMSNSPS